MKRKTREQKIKLTIKQPKKNFIWSLRRASRRREKVNLK